MFGLLDVSVWKENKVSTLIKDKSEQKLLLGHAVIVSVIMVDQLPNASLSAWMMYFIGALLGRVINIKLKYKSTNIA